MKIIICSILFQSVLIFAFSQTNIKYATTDGIAKIIQQLPEYKAEQKRVDSIGRNNTKHFTQLSVGVSVALTDGNTIAKVIITDELDTLITIAYLMEYDVKLKKVISIKKQY